MNILVLGGTRFFGVQTVRALAARGHHVTLGTRGQHGDPAPYNGEPAYTISTRRAQALGFTFSDLSTWLWPLLDQLIEQLQA